VAEEPYPEATADTGAAGDDIGSVHELYDFLRQNTETLLASDLEDTMPLRDLAESRVVDDRFGVDTHLADIAADYRQRTGRTPRAPEVYSLLEIGTAEWVHGEDRAGRGGDVRPGHPPGAGTRHRPDRPAAG
ncbi:MAG: hypothetical protein SVU88_01625, partial [Candidatus Nanohaloarchaea archaeon]|nr:hypothetical protein [Candidatus Nanohaloarchaea archaeon]